ncbi:MAG TPA: hypothetical protein VG735_07790 [Caulobacterales bacterium]|nr:hypothetical protein [Caulobacterales bacterium]
MAAIPDWLLDSGVQSLVEWAVGAIIAIGTAALMRALVQRGEIQTAVESGRTSQSPEIFVVGLLCAAVALGCLAWGVLDLASLREPGAATAWFLLIGGFALGFIVTTIYAQHRWAWDEAGLSWSGAFRKVTIGWADVRRVGKSWDGQYVVRDMRGRAIRWTTYTINHQALRAAVESRVPR